MLACGLFASLLPCFAAEAAGPQWSWGLPVYQIATRYYNVVFVVINFSSKQISGTITDALPEGDFTEAFNGGTGPLSNVVNLPGRAYRVYVMDTPPPAQSPIKSSGKERK